VTGTLRYALQETKEAAPITGTIGFHIPEVNDRTLQILHIEAFTNIRLEHPGFDAERLVWRAMATLDPNQA